MSMNDAGFGNKKVAIGQRRYLGSKTKLLTFIDEIISKENITFESFADIFAGTGVVAEYFHDRASIIVNDILESNYQAYMAYFGKQRIRTRWLETKLEEYNTVDISQEPENYFSINYANTYFDETNSKHIGYIREDIESLFRAKQINQREKAYLVTSLIYALDKIANTVGHYDAYRKIDIPLKRLHLKPLFIVGSSFGAKIYKTDANQLARKIKADIVYIDPPYNSRQYSDSYHLLENIAEWQKGPVFGVAKKIDRTHLKSQYSLKSAAYAFSDLIENLDAKYILVSYNDMGTSGDARSQSRISDHELLSALERKGQVTVYDKLFNQFTTGKSTRDDLKERVFFCRVADNIRRTQVVSRSPRNTHLSEFVKSPLNYTGGKHKLLPQITKYFPASINTFYDVFCGAANVGINAPAKEIICIDKSAKVIEVLNLIKDTNFEELNQNIGKIIDQYNLSQSYINGYEFYNSLSTSGLGAYNKMAFLKLREAYNSNKVENKPLALLVLILYAFNNQIRFNSKMEFNLPVGKRDYNGSSRRNIASFNALANTKNITFIEGDFRDLEMIKFHDNDFVYLDPPYLLGLASYNENGGWSEKDEEDLHRTLCLLDSKGVRFALSNTLVHKGKTNSLLQEWATSNSFAIHHIEHNYKNSNYQSTAKHNQTQEILVTNYQINNITDRRLSLL